MPRISVVIPVYNMLNAKEFLIRNIKSILSQNFQNYEIVISDDSEDEVLKDLVLQFPVRYFKNPKNKGMANNTNYAIDQAEGDLIKILFQDDYLYRINSLHEIVKHFKSHNQWLVTGCTHTVNGTDFFNNHEPFYAESENNIGSPSVLTFRRQISERFDPRLHWVLDLDLYKRLFRKYGKPKILNHINVVIGIHAGQKTNLMSTEYKLSEEQLLRQKYEQPRAIASPRF